MPEHYDLLLHHILKLLQELPTATLNITILNWFTAVKLDCIVSIELNKRYLTHDDEKTISAVIIFEIKHSL